MSKTKLTPEEILVKQEEVLKEVKYRLRRLKQTPHPPGEEFTRSFSNLRETYRGFGDYDVPINELTKSRKKAAQEVYKTGTHQVFCNVVTSLLETGNYVTQAENDTMTTSASHVKTLLVVIVNYSYNVYVREDMIKDSGFLSALVYTLEAGHGAHVNGELSETQNSILTCCMKILTSCACVEEKVSRLRKAGTVEVLLPYLDSPYGPTQLTSITTLAKLVNEEEADNLLSDHEDIFTLLIQRLGKAWHSSSHREKWGNSVIGLIRTLSELARNDANKQVVVDKGCLPLLVKILDSPYDFEMTESLEALWVLSFDEDNKQKMVVEPNLVKRVWGKYSYELSTPETKMSSCGILMSLKEQLEIWGHKYDGIAAKIEQQKAKADMDQGHVMLSYQSGDKKIIRKICQELKDADVPVWMDVNFMEGSTLETKVKAVEMCSIFIMAVSRGYKESSMARLEAEYAQKLEKTIIPLKMEQSYKADGWLASLMGVNYVHDFSGKNSFKDTMSELEGEIWNTMEDDTSSANNKKIPESEPASMSVQQMDRQTRNDRHIYIPLDQYVQTDKQSQTDDYGCTAFDHQIQIDREAQTDGQITTDQQMQTDKDIQTDRQVQTDRQININRQTQTGDKDRVRSSICSLM